MRVRHEADSLENYHMISVRIRSLSYLYAAVACSAGLSFAGETCTALSDQTKASLSNYVQRKYKVPKPSSVQVTDDTDLGGCYRKLTFVSDGAGHAFSTVLFLSPDQRYLAPSLFDSRSDPDEEERKANLTVQAELTKGDFASAGPADAPVTIVEFSDFQCPYCRQASQLLHEAMAGPKGKDVRLVFRHFPLEMHSWAQAAAESAACVKFQSVEGFWKIHDFLFANQQAITASNIQAKLLDQVKALNGIDLRAYQTCIDNSMSLGTVAKDSNAGAAHQVRGTPTLFVNGKRVTGIKSVDEIRSLVAQAAREASPSAQAAEANQ